MKAKKVLLGLMVAALASSCSTFKQASSTAMSVDSSVASATSAELQVANEKISYTYIPKKADRKAGLDHIINNATSDALKKNGNADVMVGRQYEVTIKKRWLRKDKIKSVTVSGYPGTYKNFKTEPVTSTEPVIYVTPVKAR